MTRLFIILSLFAAAKSAAYGQGVAAEVNIADSGKKVALLRYTVNISEADSRCRIVINDVPLLYFEGNGDRSFYANSAILNSGQQNIKIVTQGRIPNVVITETKNLPGEYFQKEIWKNNGVLEGNFIAKVPYENIAWNHSKVISEDKAAYNAALNWFKNFENLLNQGKGSEVMQQLLPAEKTATLMYSLTKEETEQFHTNWTDFISKKGYSMLGIADWNIEIVGNGKLLHIMNKLGEGGFALKADNGQLLFMDVYLHIPQDQTGVEPILANFKQVTIDFKKRLEKRVK